MAKAMKYGLWLAGIYLAISLVIMLIIPWAGEDIAEGLGWVLFVLSLPAMGLLSLIMGPHNFIVHATTNALIGIVLISISFYFLIGALIGWIKDRKPKSKYVRIKKKR